MSTVMRSIIAIMFVALGCDLPNDTSSSETDGASSTSDPTSSTDTMGMSSTSAPPTTPSSAPTTGADPVTVCFDVLGGPGFESPEEHVGTICKTCVGEDDCGCLWGVELGGACVLDCENDPCPAALTCLHLAWDGQDAWGCWPHASEGSGSKPEPEPEPICTDVVDLVGNVIGQSCQSAGCQMGVEPMSGQCIQPCELGCPDGQACMPVVIDQELTGICWPSEA